MRQDREIEALWAQCILKFTTPTRLTTLLQGTEKEPFCHTAVLRELKNMLTENITVTVGDGSPADIQSRLQAFGQWLGIDGVVSAINTARCSSLITPHRDVLEFVQAMSPVLADWPQDLPPPPCWHHETALCAHGQKCPGCGWYLRKQERDMVLNAYAAENALLVHDSRLVSPAQSCKAFLHIPSQELSVDHIRPEPDTLTVLTGLLQPQSRKNLAIALETFPLARQGKTLRLCAQVLCPKTSKVSEISKIALTTVQRPRPKITVLTLTNNHQAFIEQTIRSVCEQKTSFPVAHIILDNHSTDDTFSRIQRGAEQHTHIVPLHDLPDPTAVLFSMVDSEYVCLCDGDDYFCDPHKLQLQAEYLDAHTECSVCFHPALVHYEDGSIPDRLHPEPEVISRIGPEGITLEHLLNHNYIQTSSVMYRWRFVKGLPDWFHSFLLPADWYWHLLHAEVGSIGYIDRVMSVYRRHQNSMYADSETNVSAHTQRTGLRMLETLLMLNTHFAGQREPYFTKIALGIFAELTRAAQGNDNPKLLEDAVRQYPDFAKAFYDALRQM